MSILRIDGGRPLKGAVNIQGAKNSVLPIMAASILARGETAIHNCPDLSDVDAAIKILEHLGCRVGRNGGTVRIDSAPMDRFDIPDSLMREMRSSVIFLGAILARKGEAVLSFPGGCELGPRPIDMHLSSLRAMGAEIDETGGNIVCKCRELKGCRIDLQSPSVGATENSMLAATNASGVTVITNAAREPEIVDLQAYLRKLGACISGAGTSVITVEGRRFNNYAEHCVIPDRIVAATALSAVASASGEAEILGVHPGHVVTVTDALSDMGCDIRIFDTNIIIKAEKGLRAVRPIITRPYPGFPTDAQPPLMAACLTAEGTSVFVENIFENRFRHVAELLRMGASIKTEGRVAIVSGVKKLHAAPVKATDLRGGAALIIAALGAEGVTEISEIDHIERGYEDIAGMFTELGAEIKKIN